MLPFRAALLGLMLVLAPARATPTDAAAASAVLAQETLPALRARQAAAEARIAAAEAWFGGSGLLAAAWPALAGLPLEDSAVLDGRIDAIEVRMEARAAERVAPHAAALEGEDAARFHAAQTAALQAEDHADGLDLRLLTAMRAGIARAPALAEPALGTRLRALADARAAVTQGRTPGDDDWPRLAAESARIGAAEAALIAYRDAVRRAHGVAGDTALDDIVAVDLARLDAPGADTAAMTDRLRRVLPLLATDRERAVRAALDTVETRDLQTEIAVLETARTELAASLKTVGREPLPAAVEDYRAAMVAAERRQRATTAAVSRLEQSAGEPTTALYGLRLQAAQLRDAQAQGEAELTRRRFERAERIAELGLDGADVTEAEVEAARATAAEAREAAEQAAASAADVEASFIAQISDMSDTVLTLLEERKARSEAAQATTDDLESRLVAARTAHAAATALPPLAKDRTQRLGAAYGQIAASVRSAQIALQVRDAALTALLGSDAAILSRFPRPDSRMRDQLDPVEFERWEQTHRSLETEVLLCERTARAEVARALQLLDELRAARRDMRSGATRAELELDADNFLGELQIELGNVPVRGRVWWWTAQQARGGAGLPAIRDLLWGSIEVLLILGFWFVVRRRLPAWTTLALETAAQRQPDNDMPMNGLQIRGVLEPGDPRLALPPLVIVLRRLLDALAVWLAAVLLLPSIPPVAIPLLLLAAWQGWRLGTEMVSLGLGETDDGRPSLMRVSPTTRALAVRSASLLLGTFVVLQTTDWLATSVLMTDRISDLIQTAGLFIGSVATLVVLVRWAPVVRDALLRGDQNRITMLLVRPSNNVFLQAAQAAMGLVVLLERIASRLASRLIASRAGLAWLGAALARQRLKESHDAPIRTLAPALRARISAACHDEPQRLAELEAVQEAIEAWHAGEEPGMVAVVSDRGAGKTRLFNLIDESMRAHHSVTRLEPPDHMIDADGVLAWLADSLDCAPDEWPAGTTERAELLIRTLDRLPPRIVLIDESHRLFLRAVGGFRALRRLLDVLHASSRTHMWVCAFHGPSWDFLEGISERVNLAVFRRTVDLQPLGAETLATWLEARTMTVGLRISYADLVADSMLQTDTARVAERARASFWRLLAEESRGNPRVARGFWMSALRAGETNDEARVGLFESPQAADLAELTPRELFLLTAIVIHDGLSIDHLTEVLNLPGGVCRAVGRRLEARGLLEMTRPGDRFTTTPDWGPVIQRVLRSKQFLHGGVP